MPLGRILDIRKKVFAEVKVRAFPLLWSAMPKLRVSDSRTWVRKLAMNGQYLKFGLRLIARHWPHRAGRVPSSFGMYQLAHVSERFEVVYVQ